MKKNYVIIKRSLITVKFDLEQNTVRLAHYRRIAITESIVYTMKKHTRKK